MAYFLSDSIDALDLSAFRARYEKEAPRNQRTWIAEPTTGWIKSVSGWRQFSMRGLYRVTARWKLVYAALNLRRMCVMPVT